MKIDQQYLKNLLIAFEDSVGADIYVKELPRENFDPDSPIFIFHMRLLDDNGLIVRVDGERGFGHLMSKSLGSSARYTWVPVPLRLTARGHDFIADLRQKEVWETIKTNFKDEGISTLIGLSKSLAMGFAKKKVKDMTGLDIE